MTKLFRCLAVALAFAVATPIPAQAAAKGNYLSNIALNNLLRAAGTALPTSFVIRLYATGNCPTASTAGTEFSGNAYASITCTAATAGSACNASTSNWSSSTTASSANSNSLQFPNAASPAAWTNLQCIAITETTAANVLYFGNLTGAPVQVGIGSVATIAASALTLQEASNGMPDLDELRAALGKKPGETVNVFEAMQGIAIMLADVQAFNAAEAVAAK